MRTPCALPSTSTVTDLPAVTYASGPATSTANRAPCRATNRGRARTQPPAEQVRARRTGRARERSRRRSWSTAGEGARGRGRPDPGGRRDASEAACRSVHLNAPDRDEPQACPRADVESHSVESRARHRSQRAGYRAAQNAPNTASVLASMAAASSSSRHALTCGHRPHRERDQVATRSAGRGTASASGTARRSRPAAGRAASTASASRSCCAFLNVTVPANDRYQPRSTQRARHRRRRRRSSGTPRARGAPSSSSTRSTSSCASRSWITSALPCRLASSMCAAERLLLRRAPVVAGAEVVEAGLADGAHPRSCAASASISASAVVERAPAGRRDRGASLGCSATPATHARSCAPRRRPPSARPGRSQPICTIRGDADRGGGGERVVDVEPGSSPSAMSRWQWLSTTGTRSGSGGGGRRSRVPSSWRARVGPLAHRRRSSQRGRRPRAAGRAAAPLVTDGPGGQLAPAAGVVRSAGRRAARAPPRRRASPTAPRTPSASPG